MINQTSMASGGPDGHGSSVCARGRILDLSSRSVEEFAHGELTLTLLWTKRAGDDLLTVHWEYSLMFLFVITSSALLLHVCLSYFNWRWNSVRECGRRRDRMITTKISCAFIYNFEHDFLFIFSFIMPQSHIQWRSLEFPLNLNKECLHSKSPLNMKKKHNFVSKSECFCLHKRELSDLFLLGRRRRHHLNSLWRWCSLIVRTREEEWNYDKNK